MNKIYSGFYNQRLFSIAEANKVIKDYQQCRNTLSRLASSRQIARIKPGLYYIRPLDNPNFYPDPIHIASRLREEGVLCALTSLSLHKVIAEPGPILYIEARGHSKLRIAKQTYRIIKSFDFGTERIEYQAQYSTFQIRVTDIERTIIDCLRTRCIRAQDLISSLKSAAPEVSMRKLINYLEKYDMPILYNKAGLVLEACKEKLKIDPSDLEKIRKRLTKKIYYYKEKDIRLTRPKYQYYKEWNIMIQESLLDNIKPKQSQQSAA